MPESFPGEQHLANVVSEIRRLFPGAQVRGMGGKKLRQVDVDTVIDTERIGGIMGFAEVISKFFELRHSLQTMKEFLTAWKPAVLIVADYPDFNLRLARFAKTIGIKVIYYIPPKVWAWRSWRTKSIGEASDKIACIFPFEKKFYEDRQISSATYVGHPFAQDPVFDAPPVHQKEDFCKKYNLSPALPIVLLLPGSRTSEVKRHLTVMIEAMRVARLTQNTIQAVVVKASSLNFTKIGLDIQEPWLRYVEEPAVEVMKVCDAGILKSGTM